MAAQRCGGLAVFHSRVAAAQQGSGEEVEVSPSHVASDDCGGLLLLQFSLLHGFARSPTKKHPASKVFFFCLLLCMFASLVIVFAFFVSST